MAGLVVYRLTSKPRKHYFQVIVSKLLAKSIYLRKVEERFNFTSH
jgi:hypothetical protein